MLGISSLNKWLFASSVFNSHVCLQGITYLRGEGRKRAQLPGSYQQWSPLSSLKRMIVAVLGIGKKGVFLARQHRWTNWLAMTSRQAKHVANAWRQGCGCGREISGSHPSVVIRTEGILSWNRRVWWVKREWKRREEYRREIYAWNNTNWKRGCSLGIWKQRLLHDWQE